MNPTLSPTPSSKSHVTVVILFLIVVILLVAGYAKYIGLFDQFAPDKSGVVTSGMPDRDQVERITAHDAKTLVLAPPRAGATADEIRNYADFVKSTAKTAAALEFGVNCSPTPVAIKILKGNTLVFKNNDSAAHTVTLSDKQVVKLSPKESKTVALTIAGAAGLYTYGCDGAAITGNIVVQ